MGGLRDGGGRLGRQIGLEVLELIYQSPWRYFAILISVYLFTLR